MTVVTGADLGRRVMNALGITGNVTRITIDMAVDEIVSIKVERWMDDKEGDGLVTVLSRYEVVEKFEEGR